MTSIPQQARLSWFSGLLAAAVGLCLSNAHAQPTTNDSPSAPSRAATRPLQVVMLLPLENTHLRRAAQTVESGIKTALNHHAPQTELRSCAYGGAVNVVTAYLGCVSEDTDWVIGPLGRSDVTALAQANLLIRRPTLMLSPLGDTTPPNPMAVLAPELEAEAEAITKAAIWDGCRKPVLVEGSGPMAVRGSTAISVYWREHQAATLSLNYFNLAQSPRSEWARITQNWRNEGTDCVLYTGNRQPFAEFYPYIGTAATVYVTSAAYDSPLEPIMDWSGIRIADMPWLLHSDDTAYLPYVGNQPNSPTLARLYALGLDAGQLIASAGRSMLPREFDGTIGQLSLRNGQYQRSPVIGEFRQQTPGRR